MKRAIPILWLLWLTGAAAQPPPAAAVREWVAPEVKAPRVERRVFESAAARTKVSFFVYRPAAYDAEPARRFPVLYWLHGGGGSRGRAMTAGVAPVAGWFDNAIAAGKMPPVLVVFPNGLDSLWVDSKDGSMPVETIVAKELLPHVDAAFRTVASREGRLIEGFSMGGYGAAHLGFRYPDLFGSVSILSGGPLQREFTHTPRVGPRGREYTLQNVFGGDHDYFKLQSPWVLAERNAAALAARSRIRVVIGDRDEMLEVAREFEAQLKELRIPHAYAEVPGAGHQALGIFNGLGAKNEEFYGAVFGKFR